MWLLGCSVQLLRLCLLPEVIRALTLIIVWSLDMAWIYCPTSASLFDASFINVQHKLPNSLILIFNLRGLFKSLTLSMSNRISISIMHVYMFAFIPLAACAFHFSLFLCTSSFQVLLKVLKSTAFTEKFREVAPSEPVLLTLERLPSDGMLFRLHKHTQTHTQSERLFSFQYMFVFRV